MAKNINICNECNSTVQVNLQPYKVEYTLCNFDTTITAARDGKWDWIFIGTQCDDRCDTDGIAEGYLCSNNTQGYFEVENNLLGEEVVKKVEFHHFHCSVQDDRIESHTHRIMPNAWMSDMEVIYFIEAGVGTPKFTSDVSFKIKY